MGHNSRCKECGAIFSARRSTRNFCNASCRREYHNRQLRRGAALYSAVMVLRFQRPQAAGALTLLSRMAAAFRTEDIRERAGRQSWNDLPETKKRHGHLAAVVVGTNIAGTRRG
jgi:hypothetical protein